MSKIKVNSNVGNFLKKNKVKICALALATTMVTTLGACSNKKQNETIDTQSIISSNSESYYSDYYTVLRAHFTKNADDICVYKNLDDIKNAYLIHEVVYKETPIYNVDSDGNRYVDHYDKEVVKNFGYEISYEDAEKAGIVEFLESKVVETSKIK